MRLAFLSIGLLVLFIARPLSAQECPAWSEREALLKFLLEHRSNGTDADPNCVSRAFRSLSYDNSYSGALVKLLDFERSTKNDEKLFARSSQYPAIGALAHLQAVPQLVKVIEESDSELVRMNAAYALDLVYYSCVQTAVALLEKEATNPTATSVQQDRLRAAGKYISEHFGPRPCYSSSPSDQRQ
jgi:hypothetical protein